MKVLQCATRYFGTPEWGTKQSQSEKGREREQGMGDEVRLRRLALV